MTTYNVTTSTFSSTLTSAVNGDILVLADGNYGSLTRRRDWGHHENAVTIQSANKHGAIFSTTYIKVNNLVFDGVVLSGSTTINASNNLEFLNCKLGYCAIQAACDDILFKYCWHVGFTQVQSSGASTVSSNIIWDTCCWKYEQSFYTGSPTSGFNDWLQMQNATDCIVRKCSFWDNYAYWDGTPGTNPHLDQIQFYSNGGTCERITIEDNWCWDSTATHANAADGVQGINCGGRDILVRGNIIACTHPNSLMIVEYSGGASASIYEENLILSGPTQSPYTGALFTGGGIRGFDSVSGPGAIIRNSICSSVQNTNSIHTVSGITTGVTGAGSFDWTNSGRDITDYVPNTSGAGDVSQRWRTRLDAIIAGTADFYDPAGYNSDPVLYLADATPAAPSITGTPTISGTENVGQTLTASAASVTGTPTPTRTWQWYDTVSGAISGATSSTLTIPESAEGHAIYVIQTETNTTDPFTDTAQSENSGTIGAALSAPIISILFPANNATGVSVSTTFTVTFNQDIQFGTGNIELWRAGAPRETWSVTSNVGTGSHTVSISGAVLTIDTQKDMFEADYHIRIDAGAIESLSGAAFAGISDETTWNFSTIPTPTAGRVVFRSGGIVVSSTGLPLLTS